MPRGRAGDAALPFARAASRSRGAPPERGAGRPVPGRAGRERGAAGWSGVMVLSPPVSPRGRSSPGGPADY
ncbi:hypothetical protein GCM10010390_02890 [Streptomyces mordarskii]|uniref:Uncharacterized protein n=1 Tax=Streptomyces mordarskii TaxID=1226758 RepID=A0ABP3LQD4_9ACTN